jgi:hypothetical protein
MKPNQLNEIPPMLSFATIFVIAAHLHCLCGALVSDENGVTSKASNDFNDDGCKPMADAGDLQIDLVQHCLVNEPRTQPYDFDLQRQRCKNYQRQE